MVSIVSAKLPHDYQLRVAVPFSIRVGLVRHGTTSSSTFHRAVRYRLKQIAKQLRRVADPSLIGRIEAVIIVGAPDRRKQLQEEEIAHDEHLRR